MAQESIFPEFKLVTPVKAIVERLGAVCGCLGNLPSVPLASHGDHLPSWLPEADPRPAANELVN